MTKNKKITLKGYYESLSKISPRSQFIIDVSKRCGVSQNTVRNWVLYGMKPQKYAYIKILKEMTGIKHDDLWTE